MARSIDLTLGTQALVERAPEQPDSRANHRAIQITKQPARNASATLLQDHSSPRMVHESTGCRWSKVSTITPELNGARMLGVLVPIVSRCHKAERGPVLDRQRLTIQAVGQQHGVGQKVRERQARAVAVLTSKNHERAVLLRTSSGKN